MSISLCDQAPLSVRHPQNRYFVPLVADARLMSYEADLGPDPGLQLMNVGTASDHACRIQKPGLGRQVFHFRIRDWLSVLFYRLLSPAFGSLSGSARIVWPLRIFGARYLHMEPGSTLQYGAYVAILPPQGETAELRIGPGTMIGNHAHLVCTRQMVFGRDVLVADRVFIADNAHVFADPTTPILTQGLRQLANVQIGDGAWIGENVAIIGASVGRNSVIGANSVVTRDIGDRVVAVGSPAVPIRRYCTDTGNWRPTNPDGSFQE